MHGIWEGLRAPLGKHSGRARGSSRNVRHGKPTGHTFLGSPAALLLTGHHAQAPAVLDHSRTLPQGDGRAGPAFTGGARSCSGTASLLMRLPPRGLGSRSTELLLQNAHRCFIGKPRKPCCGHEIKAALVVLTGRHSQQQIACLPLVPIGKLAQKRNVVVCHLSVRPPRSVRSADRGGPEECASDLHSRRIAPARKELCNGSSKSEREPTKAHSTNCGSGHLIRVFRDIGRIFSLLVLLIARWSPR